MFEELETNKLLTKEKYGDIIDMEYPLKLSDTRKHPKMSIEDRAKIFAPFAALKGYETAIEGKQRIVVPKIELSDESKELLDQKMAMIQSQLDTGSHPMISVIYFQKDETLESSEDKGQYLKFTGMVAKYNQSSRILQVVDKKIVLDGIVQIVFI